MKNLYIMFSCGSNIYFISALISKSALGPVWALGSHLVHVTCSWLCAAGRGKRCSARWCWGLKPGLSRPAEKQLKPEQE